MLNNERETQKAEVEIKLAMPLKIFSSTIQNSSTFFYQPPFIKKFIDEAELTVMFALVKL
jgi:hypothetical protein